MSPENQGICIEWQRLDKDYSNFILFSLHTIRPFRERINQRSKQNLDSCKVRNTSIETKLHRWTERYDSFMFSNYFKVKPHTLLLCRTCTVRNPGCLDFIACFTRLGTVFGYSFRSKVTFQFFLKMTIT